MSDTAESTSTVAAPQRQLTLFDSTSIIVGIIIGSGIYETSPLIASTASGLPWLLGLWTLGGFLSLIGALCYAELATAYPRSGGDYVYLTRAFGGRLGFLFAWAQLWVVRPGSIGAWAYIFARYANQIRPLAGHSDAPMAYAVGAIVVLTLINLLGVRQGKWTQNVLTSVKVIGLLTIVVAGLALAPGNAPPAPAAAGGGADFRLALILILYTYGGWNEMAYVGAEVRDPKKNILRALILGTLAVTLIYVLVNLAFVAALGYAGVCDSKAVATDVLRAGLDALHPGWGAWGGRVISVLICLSALGAINGTIFTGARIYYAMGTEHRLYAWLGRWNPKTGTPVWSFVIQLVITLIPVIGFGLSESAFQKMVVFTTPVFWIFFFLVAISLFVLRRRPAEAAEPYRVPWYPLTPILFCLSSLFMIHASLTYAISNRSYEAFWSIVIMVVGLVLCFVSPQSKPASQPDTTD